MRRASRGATPSTGLKQPALSPNHAGRRGACWRKSPAQMIEPYIQVLYQALNAEHGLRIKTDDPEGVKQLLYRARQHDLAFQVLSFRVSPDNPDGEVWITK